MHEDRSNFIVPHSLDVELRTVDFPEVVASTPTTVDDEVLNRLAAWIDDVNCNPTPRSKFEVAHRSIAICGNLDFLNGCWMLFNGREHAVVLPETLAVFNSFNGLDPLAARVRSGCSHPKDAPSRKPHHAIISIGR